MLGLLGLGGLAVALLVAWAAFGLRSAYRLEGPGEDEELSLPYLAGSYLICSPNGLELARLRQRFGSLSVVPEPEVEVNGSPEATSVRWEGPEARLEIRPEGKETLYYTLVRAQKSGAGGGGERDEVSI
jgi:hypothetical protein